MGVCVQEEPHWKGVPAMAHHLTLEERERLARFKAEGKKQFI